MTEHVGDVDIARFHAGQLDRARVEEIGRHVRECPACAARVWETPATQRAAAALTRNASAEPRRRIRWLAAAAALLAILGIAAYALWHPRPKPAPVIAHVQPIDVAPPAWLHELRRGSGEVVRGPEDGEPHVQLLAPVGQGVESQTPLFRWTQVRGRCEVTVARRGEVVAASGPLTTGSWTPPHPLPRDAEYEWQLTIDANGKHRRVPAADQPPARFRIISAADAQRLATARASGDPLAAGLAAAHAGVIDEALAELARSRDPRAGAVAEKIRGW
jgi:hypothetical protein